LKKDLKYHHNRYKSALGTVCKTISKFCGEWEIDVEMITN